jgi:hypothetical protein
MYSKREVPMPQRFWICTFILSFSSLTSAQKVSARDDLFGRQLIETRLSQCVYHAGDNLEWAAPELDDTTWESISNRKVYPSQWRMWIRCHVHSEAIAGMAHPALMVVLTGAYEVFADGQRMGSIGDLRTARFRFDREQIFPIPTLNSGPDHTFAFRTANFYYGPLSLRVMTADSSFVVGEQGALAAARDHSLVAKFHVYLPQMIAGLISLILGTVLWVAFWADRSRRDLGLLAISCTMLGLSRLAADYAPNNFLFSVGITLPGTIVLALHKLLTPYMFFMAWFYFSLQKKRIPLLLKVPALAYLFVDVSGALSFFLPPRISFAYIWFTSDILETFVRLLGGSLALAPLWAFLPWAAVRKENRPIAWLSIPQSIAYLFVSLALAYPTTFHTSHRSLQAQWTWVTLVGSVISATMVVFLLRDQRKRNRERDVLAGEMRAAAQIQRLLVPQALDVAPGLSIDAVYLPAQEVGGDFYLCSVLPDGTQRVLLGDVSGKGAAAAMTAALLLGAAGRYEGDGPSLLMAHLNLTLRSRGISGFTTCICADVQPCGAAVLVNAGHLTPYKKGVEITVDSGMPLGVTLDGGYPETRVQLEPGDSLTFLSDGVVEAQAASGEMFGFDRTREISGQSARAIAEKARSFGQADDITVLTVSRVRTKSEPKV